MEADEPRATGPVLGGDLSALSIHELEARIETLRAEIIRVEAAITAKKASATAANSVFKI